MNPFSNTKAMDQNQNNLEDALKQARAVKKLVSIKEREPHILYLTYEALKRYIPSAIMTSKIQKAAAASGNKIDAAVYEISDCLAIFKRKYISSMEKTLDQAETGELEKIAKEDADILLDVDPGEKQTEKQTLVDMRKEEIINFEAMWTLYDTFKIERNERASRYHKKLLFDINNRILAYLESK